MIPLGSMNAPLINPTKSDLERWLARALSQKVDAIAVFRLKFGGAPDAQLLEIAPSDVPGKIPETAAAIIEECTADLRGLKEAERSYGLSWSRAGQALEIHAFPIIVDSGGDAGGVHTEPPTRDGEMALMMRHSQEAMHFGERAFKLAIAAIDKSYAMAAGTNEQLHAENLKLREERTEVLTAKGAFIAEQARLQIESDREKSKLARQNMLMTEGAKMALPLLGGFLRSKMDLPGLSAGSGATGGSPDLPMPAASISEIDALRTVALNQAQQIGQLQRSLNELLTTLRGPGLETPQASSTPTPQVSAASPPPPVSAPPPAPAVEVPPAPALQEPSESDEDFDEEDDDEGEDEAPAPKRVTRKPKTKAKKR